MFSSRKKEIVRKYCYVSLKDLNIIYVFWQYILQYNCSVLQLHSYPHRAIVDLKVVLKLCKIDLPFPGSTQSMGQRKSTFYCLSKSIGQEW